MGQGQSQPDDIAQMRPAHGEFFGALSSNPRINLSGAVNNAMPQVTNETGDCVMDAVTSAGTIASATVAISGLACGVAAVFGVAAAPFTFGGSLAGPITVCAVATTGAGVTAAVTGATVSAVKSAQGKRRCVGIAGIN